MRSDIHEVRQPFMDSEVHTELVDIDINICDTTRQMSRVVR